jgi:glycosyltransferase involved in cell wall biosynthesis
MSYLSAGKPIVASIDPNNASAKILKNTGAGIVISPEATALEFSEAVTKIISNPQIAISMSESGMKYSERNFDSNVAAQFFMKQINSFSQTS